MCNVASYSKSFVDNYGCGAEINCLLNGCKRKIVLLSKGGADSQIHLVDSWGEKTSDQRMVIFADKKIMQAELLYLSRRKNRDDDKFTWETTEQEMFLFLQLLPWIKVQIAINLVL